MIFFHKYVIVFAYLERKTHLIVLEKKVLEKKVPKDQGAPLISTPLH